MHYSDCIYEQHICKLLSGIDLIFVAGEGGTCERTHSKGRSHMSRRIQELDSGAVKSQQFSPAQGLAAESGCGMPAFSACSMAISATHWPLRLSRKMTPPPRIWAAISGGGSR